MTGSKVVLAGNNLAAVYALDLLLQVLEPAQVLTVAPEPSAPAPWQASLEAAARKRGVECLIPRNVNDDDVLERIREHRAGLLLSIYYTQIFREAILDVIEGPAVNFHPSLLPRHRGTAPLIWAIVEGDSQTGITVHHIDKGIDTGDVIVQHRLPIHPDDTGYELHMKMAKLVRAAAADIIRRWRAGEPIPAGQRQTGEATHHSSRDPSVNHINWSLDRARIRNIVRALAPPLPGAFALVDGEPLVLAQVEPMDGSGLRPKPAGMVELVRGDAPVVWAGDGPMRIITFVDGDAVRAGEHLPRARNLVEGQMLG